MTLMKIVSISLFIVCMYHMANFVFQPTTNRVSPIIKRAPLVLPTVNSTNSPTASIPPNNTDEDCIALNVSRTSRGHSKKIAILMFGLLRSLKNTHNSIQQYILDPIIQNGYEYDIFMHTYKLEFINNPHAHEKNIKYDLNSQDVMNVTAKYFTLQDEYDATVDQKSLFRYGRIKKWGKSPITTLNVGRQLNSLKQAWKVFKCSSSTSLYDWGGVLAIRPVQ